MKNINYQIAGLKIAQYRKEKGWTQKEFASKLKETLVKENLTFYGPGKIPLQMSQTMVGNMERGNFTRSVNFKLIEFIARVLCASAEDLIFDNEIGIIKKNEEWKNKTISIENIYHLVDMATALEHLQGKQNTIAQIIKLLEISQNSEHTNLLSMIRE